MNPVLRSAFCAVLITVLLVLGILSGFVLPHQTETCLDNYCYCENVTVGASILQPISFYSCISFYLIAYLIVVVSDSSYPSWYLLLSVFLTCAIGGTSMIFHSHQSQEGEYLDGLSISLYVWLVFILGNPWFTVLGVAGSGLIIGIMFVDGGLLYLFAILVSLLGIKLAIRFDGSIRKPLLTIAIGGTFWMLSRDELGCAITFGHGVWHVFTAIIIFILYVQEKPMKHSGIEISSDKFLLTGSNQYHQIWTRDTAMSLIVLSHIKGSEPVTIAGDELRKYVFRFLSIYVDQLDRKTHKGPKVFEKGRCNPSCRFFGWTQQCGTSVWRGWDYTSSDGDLLVEILMRENDLDLAIEFYSGYKKLDGFIVQGPYSDFQDSRDRSPVTFLTNLFYWKVLELRARGHRKSHKDISAFRDKLRNTFYSSSDNLYRSLYRGDGVAVPTYYCLQDQLFAILLKFDTRPEFIATVKDKWKDQYASSVLGKVYNDRDVPLHFIPRLACLRHYHDSIQWPWLAYFYGAITNTEVRIPVKKRYYEILSEDTLLYSSERNFLLSISFFYYYMYKKSKRGSDV